MVDYQNIVIELTITRKKIQNAFAELKVLDYQRLQNIRSYLATKNTENLQRFKDETIASNIDFENIEKSFHQVLGYVLLMEKEGHKHPLFKELLKRSEVMREILQALFKQQKKQVAIASSLKKGRWNFVSEIQEKRLVRSLRKEQDLVTVLAGVYKHEKERVKAIFEAYEHEKKKQAMVAAAAVAAWTVPALGTALSLSIFAAYDWANESSKNYKLLLELSK